MQRPFSFVPRVHAVAARAASGPFQGAAAQGGLVLALHALHLVSPSSAMGRRQNIADLQGLDLERAYVDARYLKAHLLETHRQVLALRRAEIEVIRVAAPLGCAALLKAPTAQCCQHGGPSHASSSLRAGGIGRKGNSCWRTKPSGM